MLVCKCERYRSPFGVEPQVRAAVRIGQGYQVALWTVKVSHVL
jgi:hypothetical protein